MLVSFANATKCVIATKMAEKYAVIAGQYNVSTVSNACKMADALEQVVNYMGTMKNECPNFEEQRGMTYKLNIYICSE